MAIVGRSFKDDDLWAFQLIEKMYIQRNSLMHSGVLNAMESINTVKTIRTIEQYLSASEKAVA